ncbi:FxLYD domain-containing protein [Candidatus Bipolaricaulota bacterium]|nr:FxLYD domain-containing protein [Candidatus Bipolaricaulota bacterium]
MDSSKIPLVIGALVVFGALTAGILYSNYNSVAVEPYQDSQFKATGTYNASENELKGTLENVSDREFGHVEVKAKFLNPEGTILSTGKDYFRNFGSGESYRFKIWFEPDITDYTGKIELDVEVTDK